MINRRNNRPDRVFAPFNPACTTFDCFGAGQWVSEHLFESADWRHSAELAKEMFSAYRHWLPRFRAAALIEAALPHVRSESHASLVERMIALVSRDATPNQFEVGANKLHAETLTVIRKSLRDVEDTDDIR